MDTSIDGKQKTSKNTFCDMLKTSLALPFKVYKDVKETEEDEQPEEDDDEDEACKRLESFQQQFKTMRT